MLVPVVSGDAGAGDLAPGYDDAFDPGVGFDLRVERRLAPRVTVVGVTGYQSHSGNHYEGFSFGDLEVIPVYFAGRYALVERAAWKVRVGADLGTARLSDVDVAFDTDRVRYWDASWVVLWGVGGEVVYGRGPLTVSVDFGYRELGSPDTAFGPPSEAESSSALPLRFSLRYTF